MREIELYHYYTSSLAEADKHRWSYLGNDTCIGYVRRVTHDEIADAVG